jgi:hypothetical protein
MERQLTRTSKIERKLNLREDLVCILPALVVVAVLVIWTCMDGGFQPTVWYPGTVLILALLALMFYVRSLNWQRLSITVRIAVLSLLLYTLWNYLSILWAQDKGPAWDGANRTLLYLLIFVLFACWAYRPRAAALILGCWTSASFVIATVILVRLPHIQSQTLFIGERLAEPAGYTNAAAAGWMMAFWPALLLASQRMVPYFFRGIFAGGAVILFDVTLLSQSRGMLFASIIVFILLFVVVRQRVRLLVTMIPIVAGIFATAPALLDVSQELREQPNDVVLNSVASPVILAACLVGIVIMIAGVGEKYLPLKSSFLAKAHHVIGAFGLSATLIGLIVTLAIIGNPVQHVQSGWSSFKRGYTIKDNHEDMRLTAGLGSDRYDLYRVGFSNFTRHPLIGIGSDNFALPYLIEGRSDEQPRYPHSLELRALLQTGLIGASLLLLAIGAACVGALLAIRRLTSFGAALASGGLLVFVYWLVHGSVDWFWEFPSLGGSAFAMLGLACGLLPQRPLASISTNFSGSYLKHMLAGGLAVAFIIAGVVLVLPWFAARDVQDASQNWPTNPAAAYRQLERSAHLNPLSDQPYLVAGAIASQQRNWKLATKEFELALARQPRRTHAWLELGALASTQGKRGEAKFALKRAVALSPRDYIARSALQRVVEGQRVSVTSLNASIIQRMNQLVR